jgi:hypothetical protein
MQSLFDPVIKEITNLVGQQVREAEAKRHAAIDVLYFFQITSTEENNTNFRDVANNSCRWFWRVAVSQQGFGRVVPTEWKDYFDVSRASVGHNPLHF